MPTKSIVDQEFLPDGAKERACRMLDLIGDNLKRVQLFTSESSYPFDSAQEFFDAADSLPWGSALKVIAWSHEPYSDEDMSRIGEIFGDEFLPTRSGKRLCEINAKLGSKGRAARKIAELCVKRNIYVISDEIYEHLIYDGNKHCSIASFGEDIKNLTIIVNGVSKTYAMTGWRIGYTASNKEIAKIMSNVQSHATSNPNSIAQKATVAALNGPMDEFYKMREEFQKRRNYMVERINSIEGVSCIKPKGAFYVMMNIEKVIGKSFNGKVIDGSDSFAKLLVDEAKVAVVPCSGFESDIHVRWSYATSMENIEEGLNRLESFLNKLA
jgi:hypothetical protein